MDPPRSNSAPDLRILVDNFSSVPSLMPLQRFPTLGSSSIAGAIVPYKAPQVSKFQTCVTVLNPPPTSLSATTSLKVGRLVMSVSAGQRVSVIIDTSIMTFQIFIDVHAYKMANQQDGILGASATHTILCCYEYEGSAIV